MKKFFSLLTLALLTLSVGATTYTHTFASGQLKTKAGTVTLSGVEWTQTAATFIGFDTSDYEKGVQVGSSKNPTTSFSLSTDGITGTITSITVNSSIAKDGDAKMTVKVGEEQWGETTDLVLDATDYTFTGEASGRVEISYTATAKAFYIKSITIVYEGGEVPPEPAVAAPVFNPNGGNFTGSQEVTLTCATENASIYYWVGEQDAVAEWIYYKEPFYVTETTTYTAVATKGDDISDYTTVTFTKKTPQCAKPKFTPANGTTFMQGEELDVTINCDTEGATIKYALNDGEFQNYSAPIHLTETTTIKAVASAEGYIDSDEATATYTMVVPETTGPIFNLVTDVTTLADGDHIILVNTAEDGTAVAMGPINSNGRNFLGKNVIVNNGQVQTEEASIITLEKSGDYWNLKTSDKYIFAPGNNNYMQLEDAVDGNGNANAAITVNADTTTIVFQGDGERKIVRYNSNNGSPIFSCYAPTSSVTGAIYIYKTTEDVPEPPVTEYVDVNNFAEAYALESGTKVKMLNDAVVTYQNGSRLFVRDTEGTSGLIYGSLGKTFENGQVLGDEWTATYQLFNGNTHEFEILNAEEIFASGETRNAAPVECASISANIVNEYVILKGVTLQADTTANIFYTANNIQICNFFNGVEIPEVKENSTYDVTGIVMLSKAGQVRVYVTEMTEVSSQTLVGDVDEDGNVNITDVTALIDMLLSDNTKPSGDVNGDGQINITDVTDLIDILLKN